MFGVGGFLQDVGDTLERSPFPGSECFVGRANLKLSRSLSSLVSLVVSLSSVSVGCGGLGAGSTKNWFGSDRYPLLFNCVPPAPRDVLLTSLSLGLCVQDTTALHPLHLP